MQFRHAVGLGALKANNGDEIARELAVPERGLQFLLAVEYSGRCLDHVALRRTAEILMTARPRLPIEHARARRSAGMVVDAAQDVRVAAGAGRPRARRSRHPSRARARPHRRESAAPDRLDVLMQQPAVEQFANQEADAAGGMEVVHVGLAVRIDARQQRRHLGEVGEVVPV